MINEFSLRLHTQATEALAENDPASWTLQRGRGALTHLAITKISNPMPEIKSNSVDVPASNGALDATEAGGRVYYKNKPVSVTFQTLPKQREWFPDLHDAFASLHGRLVDFSFEDALDVEWYYTGRLTVSEENPETGELTVKIDTQPFQRSTVKRVYDIPTGTLMDRAVSGWSVDEKSDTATVSLWDSRITIYGRAGDVVRLKRTANAGTAFAFATYASSGGDYVFGNGSRTIGKPDGSGELTLTLTLDGSEYDWTTENGEHVYKPSMSIKYFLTQLELDADGRVIGEDGDVLPTERNAIVLPSNVCIRPELYNYGDAADVLLDGERIYLDPHEEYRTLRLFPDAVLPGVHADFGAEQVVCILAVTGNAGNDEPDVQIRYREERLG